MVRKALGLLVVGGAIGFAANRTWRELRKPAPDQFPWLRARMNDTVNPWLIGRGIPGGATAEIACLEHVGRKSGTTFFTPVHPAIRDQEVLIPAPLGVGSQWARNILEAGRARLQFHETLHELDRPELITVTEAGLVPHQVAGPFDHMGWRYLRMRLVATVPGTFATHKVSMPAMDGMPVMDQPLEGSYEIPMEPRMVERPVETT
ncbi:MAG: PNPOx family protein [Candidatus Limnocylindrales bacterium]